MKWFFAYNGFNPWRYDAHIKMMVRSAVANTSLDGHLLYSGPPENPILSFVESQGVNVIHRKPSILGDLERMKAKFPDYELDVATGAFLRMDVPLICKELGYDDEFILYTDCDVVFLRELPSSSSEPSFRPTLFSCAPEIIKEDWRGMNSGVMVMNIDTLLADHPSFKRFITSGDTLYYELFKQGPYDQAAYQIYYESKWDKLPMEYNWKPYWGFNEDAFILHFHGPKVSDVRKIMKGMKQGMPRIFRDLFYRDPEAYEKYLELVAKYRG
jgi:hypothetical protein